MVDLSTLNEPQREAVLHDSGPLLVLAGAGSGKTRVITCKIARAVFDLGVSPHRILALTFTNKAAGEMASRVESLAGLPVKGMWVGTFHSLCARLLRIERVRGGNFVIYDSDDQKKVAGAVLEKLGLKENPRYSPGFLLSSISSLKNRLIFPDEAYPATSGFGDEAEVLRKAYRLYVETLLKNNAFDFDDLIVEALRMLKGSPEILEKYQTRFEQVLVDEYQDTNTAQYRLVELFSGGHRNITAVGDDDQSIYGWRGADLRNILDFEKAFPETRVIRLEQNYRSTQTILTAANAVISHNRDRKPKTLWTTREEGAKIDLTRVSDEREEALMIARRLQSAGLAGSAVFYRTNAQSRPLEEAFRNLGLPYALVGGLKFYERKEIKDILAYLRVLTNPSDSLSLSRIINVPKRGIGDKLQGALENFSAQREIPLYSALQILGEIEGLSGPEREKLSSFRALLDRLKTESGTAGLSEFVDKAISDTGYRVFLESSHEEEALDRLANLGEFVNAVREYCERAESSSLQGFLEEVSLITDIDTLKEDGRGHVTLMTLHASKGLEFDRVFITGMEEGLFPLTRMGEEPNWEEERRLFYVGITRAKQSVALFHAALRRKFGYPQTCEPSPFLKELPEGLLRQADFTSHAGYQPANAFRPRALPVIALGEARMPDYEGESQAGGEYFAGQRITHPVFGEGTILSLSGFSENLKATIRFQGDSVKKVMVKYAKLSPVG